MKRQVLTTLPLLLVSLAGCGHKPAVESTRQETVPVPVVQAATVETGSIEDILPAAATVTAILNREATIVPPVAGQLDSLPVRVGEEVTRGQVVAHLSTRTLTGQIEQASATIRQDELQTQQAEVTSLEQQAQTRATVEQAQSAVANARATLASAQATLTGDLATLRNAQQSLTREQTLQSEGLVARKDVEAAELAVQTAQAQVDAQRQTIDAQRQTVDGQLHALQAAKAAYLQDAVKRKDVEVARQQTANARGALETAQAQAALYTLRAPLSGRVVVIGANLGETVDTSTKLVTLANLDRMQLQIAVPTESASKVHAGQEVTFTVDGLPGRVFRTVIETVGSQVDPSTSTVPAYGYVENLAHLLQDDEAAKARIVLDRQARTILVPRGAVLTDPASGDKSVAVIGDGGVVHIRKVKVGIEQGDKVEITGGLGPNEKVAIAGQYALPDGTKVSVQSAP